MIAIQIAAPGGPDVLQPVETTQEVTLELVLSRCTKRSDLLLAPAEQPTVAGFE